MLTIIQSMHTFAKIHKYLFFKHKDMLHIETVWWTFYRGFDKGKTICTSISKPEKR